jgi:hypothetical protein
VHKSIGQGQQKYPNCQKIEYHGIKNKKTKQKNKKQKTKNKKTKKQKKKKTKNKKQKTKNKKQKKQNKKKVAYTHKCTKIHDPHVLLHNLD